jgi:hypothetical protein
VTKRRPKRKGDGEPTALTRSDKAKIAAFLAAAPLILFGWIHLQGTRSQGAIFDRRIEGWRGEYHLNDEQARRVRGIEEEFHGSGNPLVRPEHTTEEVREHHRALASAMNPEDGARFLAAHEKHGRDAPDRSH